MKKAIVTIVLAMICVLGASAQGLKRVYNTTIDPIAQIDSAITKAASQQKFVICQVGGNWCPWCLRFANFITTDSDIAKLVDENFVYIHVNYLRSDKTEKPQQLMSRLGNPQRFGFPVMVVLDGKGNVVHIQDSSFLESGTEYDKQKVIRFFSNWTPTACGQK